MAFAVGAVARRTGGTELGLQRTRPGFVFLPLAAKVALISGRKAV